jgi:hypothetical protein
MSALACIKLVQSDSNGLLHLRFNFPFVQNILPSVQDIEFHRTAGRVIVPHDNDALLAAKDRLLQNSYKFKSSLERQSLKAWFSLKLDYFVHALIMYPAAVINTVLTECELSSGYISHCIMRCRTSVILSRNRSKRSSELLQIWRDKNKTLKLR